MTVARLVEIANGGVPSGALKPHNCHKVPLGWVLQAKCPTLMEPGPMGSGVERGWVTLRSITERYGGHLPKQLTGPWVGTHLYSRNYSRVRRENFDMIGLGDILFMGAPNQPHHSMIVVDLADGAANARGFNTADAFGSIANPIFGAAAPFMAFDINLRNIAKLSYWNLQTGLFRAASGECPIHRISYEALCEVIPDDMNF